MNALRYLSGGFLMLALAACTNSSTPKNNGGSPPNCPQPGQAPQGPIDPACLQQQNGPGGGLQGPGGQFGQPPRNGQPGPILQNGQPGFPPQNGAGDGFPGGNQPQPGLQQPGAPQAGVPVGNWYMPAVDAGGNARTQIQLSIQPQQIELLRVCQQGQGNAQSVVARVTVPVQFNGNQMRILRGGQDQVPFGNMACQIQVQEGTLTWNLNGETLTINAGEAMIFQRIPAQ